MSTEQEIRFRVVMDDAGVEPASRRTEASVNAVKQAVERSGVAMLKFGKDGQATAHQLQALSYQTTDIVTGCLGHLGAHPSYFTVAIHRKRPPAEVLTASPTRELTL